MEQFDFLLVFAAHGSTAGEQRGGLLGQFVTLAQ